MLGENLIAELGPYGFVRKVLNSIDKHPIVVLDGVRHIEIWQAVCLFTFQNTLIYLDIEESIRLNRLKNRDGLDDESIKNAMHHPMEENIPQLKSLADIVLSEGTIEEMVAEILSRLEEL
jgi:dephospho-CoA kinase